jgi:hypothetical protein
LNDAYADTLWRYREAFGDPPADTWISKRRLEMRSQSLQASEVQVDVLNSFVVQPASGAGLHDEL